MSLSDGIKTASGRQRSKKVLKVYLEIVESYHVCEHILGIYAKSFVYREVFEVNVHFDKELGTKS